MISFRRDRENNIWSLWEIREDQNANVEQNIASSPFSPWQTFHQTLSRNSIVSCRKCTLSLLINFFYVWSFLNNTSAIYSSWFFFFTTTFPFSAVMLYLMIQQRSCNKTCNRFYEMGTALWLLQNCIQSLCLYLKIFEKAFKINKN